MFRSGRHCYEILDTLPQETKRTVKRRLNIRIASGRLCRVRRAPMQFLRCSMKEGAAFTGGLIAHSNDEIERVTGKLIPRLAARLTRINAVPLQGCDGLGMDMSRRIAARAPCPILTVAQVIDQRFRHH